MRRNLAALVVFVLVQVLSPCGARHVLAETGAPATSLPEVLGGRGEPRACCAFSP